MKKLIIRLFIFFLIFALLSVGITYFLIKKNKKIDIPEEKEEENVVEKTIDLYGTYNQNDLIVNTIVKIYNGKEVEIPQIEGLKNKEVEYKINSDMLNRIESLVKDEKNMSASYFNVTSNFANTISITFGISIKKSEDEYFHKHIFFNYELVNGQEIKLEDVFTKNANIEEMVRKKVYEYVAREDFNKQLQEMSEKEIWDYDNVVANPNEERIYELVNKFEKENNKQFYFSPSEITISIDDKNNPNYDGYDVYLDIDFVDIADQVVIYNKYLTKESIFLEDNIGKKELFTCTNTPLEDMEYGYLDDNFFYDITMQYNYFEAFPEDKKKKYTEFKQKYIEELKEYVYKYRKTAQSDQDNFYIILQKPNISVLCDESYDWKTDTTKGEYSNILYTFNNIYIYKFPMNKYKDKIKDIILEGYRYKYFMLGGGVQIFLDEGEEEVLKDIQEITSTYNYVENKKIDNVKDLFKNDTAYMDIIDSKIVDKLMNENDYIYDEAVELAQTAKLTVNGNYINVSIPNINEEFLKIDFFYDDVFDISMFKN